MLYCFNFYFRYYILIKWLQKATLYNICILYVYICIYTYIKHTYITSNQLTTPNQEVFWKKYKHKLHTDFILIPFIKLSFISFN